MNALLALFGTLALCLGIGSFHWKPLGMMLDMMLWSLPWRVSPPWLASLRSSRSVKVYRWYWILIYYRCQRSFECSRNTTEKIKWNMSLLFFIYNISTVVSTIFFKQLTLNLSSMNIAADWEGNWCCTLLLIYFYSTCHV